MTMVIRWLLRKRVFFYLVMGFGIFWLALPFLGLFGFSATTPGESNRRYVQKQTDALKAIDPEAAATLSRLAETKDIAALSANLRFLEYREGRSALRSVATALQHGDDSNLPWYPLTAAVVNPRFVSGNHERETFGSAHGTAYQVLLNADSSGTAAARYASLLTAVQESGDRTDWAVIRDDPIALVVYGAVKDDPALWAFFGQEREWLGAALSVLSPEGGNTAATDNRYLADLVAVAKKHHPHVKDAYLALVASSNENDDAAVIPEMAGLVLGMFDRYGDMLSEASTLKVPVVESMEVVFANPDVFADSAESNTRQAGAWLAQMRHNRPAVWAASKLFPRTLWLEQLTPDDAELVLQKYPDNNIPEFIYTHYRGQATTAARSLVLYGDPALYFLDKYKEHDVFRSALADPKIGPRVIPFVLRFGDEGFANLEQGLAWVDKYFQEDGTPRDPNWIQAVPLVGNAANVLQNWANGVPNTWGELGWAAFDAADAALLLASFGTSSVATTATKTGGKKVAQGAGRNVLAREGAEHVARRVGREGAEEMTKRGALVAGRSAARGSSSSLLRSFGTAMTRTLSVAHGMISTTMRIGRYVVNSVTTAAIWTATTAYRAWRSIPPTIRTWMLRGIAAAGIIYSTTVTLQRWEEIKPLERMTQAVMDSINAIRGQVNDSLKIVVEETFNPKQDGVHQYGFWALVMVAVLFSAWVLRPKGRRLTAVR